MVLTDQMTDLTDIIGDDFRYLILYGWVIPTMMEEEDKIRSCHLIEISGKHFTVFSLADNQFPNLLIYFNF